MKFSFVLSCALLIGSIGNAANHDSQKQLMVKSACRCEPNQECYPKEADWLALESGLSQKLIQPVSPMVPCQLDAKSVACQKALQTVHNPFLLEDDPGAAQSQGWFKAWELKPSTHVIVAKSTSDVAKAVNFARIHNLKLVIKNTGHDYLGRSTAPNSLMIWTHEMRGISFNKHFIPKGCDAQSPSYNAINVNAGTRWVELYKEATLDKHVYVQGGGCTTVGAAGGFTLGGGMGLFSKKYGTGAAGLLEAEVVLANGTTIIANECQNSDLFWGLRGGGGGTFGVVTKMTYKVHPLTNQSGLIQGSIKAKNDASYKILLKKFLAFYDKKMNNEHWGDIFSFNSDNSIQFYMFFQGVSGQEAQAAWDEMGEWLINHKSEYAVNTNTMLIPPEQMWDANFWEKNNPNFIQLNPSQSGIPGAYWYTMNNSELFRYWYSYQSWWIPQSLFKESRIDKLAETVFLASRLINVEFHTFKGLAGASKDAIEFTQATSTNPAIFNASGIIIISSGNNQVYPGVANKDLDHKEAEIVSHKIIKAIQYFMQLAPQSGAYLNEADYFQKDWQRVFWGDNYSRLLKIKKKYDPQGLFYCHHCVGSEFWDAAGMCRVRA